MRGARNVLGGPLAPCGVSPLAGFARDGHCDTDAADVGSHTVCAQMTHTFLRYAQSRGNDLVTPAPDHEFPGLQAGDRWCLCASRWLEAAEDGVAPPVILEATHERALQDVALADLVYHALRDPDAAADTGSSDPGA